MTILEGLNPAQLEAVTHVEGPLLILAGPGSGKTRVIAHRIAYLVQEKGIPPHRVMAVTFTNKAARELRDRVEGLLGSAARNLTLGTFHSVCSRILRIDGEQVGIPRSFVIYDDSDQMGLMKRVCNEMNLDSKQYPPRAILSVISKAKSELKTPEAFSRTTATYFEEIVARAYQRYQALLVENSAVDFDDILLETVELLRGDEHTRDRYRERYQQVMIDEFQDTNIAQYLLARELAPPPSANLTVVGDPDQSIYSWRSADIRNILNFEKDYKNATVVRLEQNYRSTQNILDSAQRIIASNTQRKEKNLWTEKGPGDPIVVYEAYNEEEEASYITAEIKRLERSGVRLGDVAVMYRTNAQSRALEERFVASRVPYRLVGGTRFYERREIKDLLAYLRLVVNPFDSISLDRVLNVPPRRIGDKTREELRNWAQTMEVPVYTALQMLGGVTDEGHTGTRADGQRDEAASEQAGNPVTAARLFPDETPRVGVAEVPNPFNSSGRTALLSFLEVLNGLIAEAPVLTVAQLLAQTIERTQYRAYLYDAFPVDGEERWENVQELRNVAAQFDELEPEHALTRFLEDVALMSDADEYDEKVEAVTLITLHAAKGLEFPLVFIVGMEEGILPHIRSFDDPQQMEEERRLAYVGVTRAKDRLYLLRAFRRSMMGSSSHNPPSRFLKDLPPELVHQVSQGVEHAYQSRPALRPRQPAWSTTTPSSSGLASRPDTVPARAMAVFKAGEHVRHARFGEGIVVSAAATASGSDQEVTVAFKGESGVKKLLLSFAPLEKLD